MTKEGARQLEKQVKEIERNLDKVTRSLRRRKKINRDEPIVSSYQIVESAGDTLGDLGAGLEVRNGRNRQKNYSTP